MTTFGAFIASPWGSVVVIAAMALVTFLCRIAGVVVMSRAPSSWPPFCRP
jgi:hypothetical protein